MPKWSPKRTFHASKEAPQLELRHTQCPDTSHKPVKTNPKVPNVPPTSYILPRSKNRCLAKVHFIEGRRSKIETTRSNITKYLQKPQIRYNRLRKHQASVSASLGLAMWHMQNMQTSEFLQLGPFFWFCC